MAIVKVKCLSSIDDVNDYNIRAHCAAKRLNIPFHTVYRLIGRGDIDARNVVGVGVMVSERSLYSYIEKKDACVKKK